MSKMGLRQTLLKGRKAPGGGGIAFTTVDWLHRGNTAASDGATPTTGQLDGGTFGLATGSWTKTGADGFWVQSSSNNPSIPGLGLSGGSGAGAATKNMSFDPNVDPTITFRGATFTWGSAKANLSVGFAIRFDADFDPPNDVGDLYHSVRLEGGGNFFIAGCEVHDTSEYKMFAHCNTVDGGYSGLMTVGAWYWVTMLWTTSTNCDLRVFGPLPSLSQVGTTSSGTKTDGSTSCAAIRCFGRTDNTGQLCFNTNAHRSTCHTARFANVHPLLPTF